MPQAVKKLNATEITQNTRALSTAMNQAIDAGNIDSAKNVLMDILGELNKLKRLQLESSPCVNSMACGG